MRISVIIILAILIALLVVPVGANTEYQLCPEDVITITIIRHPEFSGEFLIPADGKANLPGIGLVQASGKTIGELSGIISNHLRERLKDPEVFVTLKQQSQQRVYLLGSIFKPGVYDLKPGQRIAELVATAGGIIGEAADCKITLMRASNAKQQTVAFANVLEVDSKDNLALEPGDVVNAETIKQLPVYVMGQVKQPGILKLREDSCGLMEALALAGGALDEAALDKITITHTSGASQTIDLSSAIRNGDQQAAIKLESGDLVVVPESQNRIAVLGYINGPGYFTLKGGQKITLSDAVALAGGLVPKKSKTTEVLVLRTTNGKQERLICDLSRFFKTGDSASNPVIQPGDVVYVPKSDSPEWDTIIRALSSASIVFNAIY